MSLILKYLRNIVLCVLILFWSVLNGITVYGQEALLELNQEATNYFQQGDYASAATSFEKLLEAIANELGEHHEAFGNVLNSLGGLYSKLGETEKAINRYQQAIEVIDKLGGAKHKEYANRLNNLALVYKNVGRYEESMKLILKAKKITERNTGKTSLEYAVRLHNLGALYKEVGKMKLAEEHILNAIQITKDTLGESHAYIFSFGNTLADIYESNNLFEKALPIRLSAVEWVKEQFGMDHPEYGNKLNSLALLQSSMGKEKEAIHNFKLALRNTKKTLGPKHYAHGVILGNLAESYLAIAKYDKALEASLEAINHIKLSLDDNHPTYLVHINTVAQCYMYLNDFEKANKVINEGLNLLQKNELSYPQAKFLLSAIPIKQQLGKNKESLELVTILAKYLDGFDPNQNRLFVAETYNDLGIAVRELGQFELALEYYKKSTEIIEIQYGQQSMEFAVRLSNQAEIYHLTGFVDTAIDKYNAALDILSKKRMMNTSFYSTLLNNLSMAYIDIGEIAKAKEHLTQALNILEKLKLQKTKMYASRLNNLAFLRAKEVNWIEATLTINKSLDTYKGLGDTLSADYGQALNNLGSILENQGYFEKALFTYYQTLELYEKINARKDFVATIQGNIAGLYLKLGDFENAIEYMLKCKENLKISVGSDNPAYVLALSNITKSYLQKAWHTQENHQIIESASLYCDSAIQLSYEVLGPNHSVYWSTLSDLADIKSLYYSNIDTVEHLYKSIIDHCDKYGGDANLDCFTIRNNFAFLLYRKGNISEAEKEFIRLKKRKEWKKSLSNAYRVNNNLLSIYMQDGRKQLAIDLIEEINYTLKVEILNNRQFLGEQAFKRYLDSKSYLFDLIYSTNLLLDQGVTRVTRLGYSNSIWSSGLTLKNNKLITELLGTTKNQELKGDFIVWQKLKNQLQEANVLNTKTLSQDSISALIAVVENRLISKLDFGKESTVSLPFNRVKKNLRNDEAAITVSSFKFYNGQKWTDSTMYAAYVVSADFEEPQFIYLFEQRQLDSLLASKKPNELYAYRSGFPLKVDVDYSSSSQELYNLIIKPLEPYLKGKNKIYFSPEGSLHQIAFSALTDSSGELLSSKYQLEQLSSAAKLVFNEREPQQSPAVMIGGVTYDYQPKIEAKPEDELLVALNPFTIPAVNDSRRNHVRGEAWSYLPGTMEEVNNLQRLYEKNKLSSTLVTKKDATEAYFKSLSGNSPAVLHIATHGFFFENPEKKHADPMLVGQENNFTLADDPLMRAGLMLAGSNYTWENGSQPFEKEDGVLTAYEIAQMDLTNTDLVVLSACETALGDINGSEGVYGLQRAFKMAGVDYLIMSLWSVPDKETSEFMTMFYEHWLGGKPLRESFQDTQNQMSQRYPNEPQKWAGFVLVE